ncbi:MAG: hypothetical protein RIF46_14475 [Cyclobacteriaceae bacterium]
MTRKVLPFFLIFSLLLLVGCILIPSRELRMGMTTLVSFLTVATASIIFIPWGKGSDLEEKE